MSTIMNSNGVDGKRLLKEAKKLILSSNSEDVNKGLKNLKKLIKSDPDNVWAFIFYGVGAWKSEKHRHEAVPAFRTASNIDPDSVECWKGIRACLEAKTSSDQDISLLIEAYSNLLRLENDLERWKALYKEILETSSASLSVSHVASLLSSLIDEDHTCKASKHETACKDLASLVFSDETLLETNMDDALKAFQSWANFLDFSDRPEFCKKVCSLLKKHNYFSALSVFLHHTLLFYGSKLYMKIQLMQYLVDIALDCLDNVEKLIPFVKAPLKEIENVKNFNQIKLALCVINFFEDDFTKTREHLENLSCAGDINAMLFLLKFLCKAKDYENVLFLCVRFAKTFALFNNNKLKFDFILCLLESLSSCNEVVLLEYAIKLGLQSLSMFGENHNLVYYLSHSYVGLLDPKAVFYLNKLKGKHIDGAGYIEALLNQDASYAQTNSDKWLSNALLSANFDLIDNNIKRAVKNFTKIGVKDNCVCEPFLILGVDSSAKGDVSKATACFHRAFSLQPLDAVILKRYLDSILKMNDDQQAIQVLEAVRNSNFGKWHLVGEKALFALCLIHSAKYHHEKSIRSLRYLIKLNPDCMEFIEAMSDEYIHLGRLGIAENYISRLVLDDPYNLHSLVRLCEIYKLDVNYSAYFNQALKCLNFSPRESEEASRVTKLVFSFFINFFNQYTMHDETFYNYITKHCEATLKRIDHIVDKGNIERPMSNEYLIALYKFIESHFLAVVKLMKLKEKELESRELITFCVKSINSVIQVYGANFICFWKLYGDVLLSSAQIPSDLEVSSWLLCGDNVDLKNSDLVKASCLDRINAAIKCYVVGLNLVEDRSTGRAYEFYYDISVALITFANHHELVDPELRYNVLKASLESCLKSFVHSDGMSSTTWIHSNLLGIIVSLLGVRENMFKEHFSSREINMNEGVMLQNYATYLAKNGLYNHAEETFEQARLRVDMDYSSSWVGQLLMQLVNNDMETRKMLEYNLTQIGTHPLFKWLLGYYLCKNKLGLNLHGGQFSLLNYAFSDKECVLERSPSRLTLMAYIHELIGNYSVARRLYFRVLRLAKHVDEDTYNYFLTNAIRLNPHCKLNYELIEQLSNDFSPSAPVSLFKLCSNHISIFTPNRHVLFKALIVMNNLLNILSANEEKTLVMVIPLLNILNDLNLSRYLDSKVPFILEYLVKNIVVLLRRKKKEFRQVISVMDPTSRTLLLKHINKFVSLNKFRQSSSCTGLISKNSISCLMKRPVDVSLIPVQEDPFNLPGQSSDVNNTAEDLISSETNRTSSFGKENEASCSYSKVLTRLRTIFPLPLTDEERMVLKRNKILSLQSLNATQPDVKTFRKEDGSFLELMESHGCHSNCTILFALLQRSVSMKQFPLALKYVDLCLNIRCTSCTQILHILPLVCVVSLESKNVRLVQKALHLYPSHPLLRKTALVFFTGIRC